MSRSNDDDGLGERPHKNRSLLTPSNWKQIETKREEERERHIIWTIWQPQKQTCCWGALRSAWFLVMAVARRCVPVCIGLLMQCVSGRWQVGIEKRRARGRQRRSRAHQPQSFGHKIQVSWCNRTPWSPFGGWTDCYIGWWMRGKRMQKMSQTASILNQRGVTEYLSC